MEECWPWHSDGQPLSREAMQQGYRVQFQVPDEKASLGSSTVDNKVQIRENQMNLMSHFLALAMRVRETTQRIRPPSTFRAPPRVTLSEERRDAWLTDLSDINVVQRKLSRTIPNGISGRLLLDQMLLRRVPISRATWFFRSVGANELRSLRRNGSESEHGWLVERTDEITAWISAELPSVIGFSTDWDRKTKYAMNLAANLFYEGLCDRARFVNWLLTSLEQGDPVDTPIYVYLIGRVWRSIKRSQIVSGLVRSVAKSYRHHGKHKEFREVIDPLLRKIVEELPSELVQPSVWCDLEAGVCQVAEGGVFDELRRRNALFMAEDPPKIPYEWSLSVKIGKILETFTVPFNLGELLHSFPEDVSQELLVRTLLLWTVRKQNISSVTLCVSLLRMLRQYRGVPIQDHIIAFLTGQVGAGALPGPVGIANHALYDLITECYVTGLLNIEAYFTRLIATGIIYLEGSQQQQQKPILRNLPYELMSPAQCVQARMLLKEDPTSVDVSQVLEQARTGSKIDIPVELTKNQRICYAKALVSYAKLHPPKTPQMLEKLVNALERIGDARGLNALIYATVSHGNLPVIACCARQVHLHLLLFTCTGHVESFVYQLMRKIRELGPTETNTDANLQQTILALRDALSSPSVLADFGLVFATSSSNTFPVATPPDTATGGPKSYISLVHSALISSDFVALSSLKEESPNDFTQVVLDWIEQDIDRGIIMRLVVCELVNLDSIQNLSLLLWLLLIPGNDIGLCYEEITQLEKSRQKFIADAGPARFLRLWECASECFSGLGLGQLSQLTNKYPDLCIQQFIKPILAAGSSMSERLKRITTRQSLTVADMLFRANPFNLRLYQGLVLVAFDERDEDNIAEEVLKTTEAAAMKAPETIVALQSLFTYTSQSIKTAIAKKAVEHIMISTQLNSETIDAFRLLVGLAPANMILGDLPSLMNRVLVSAQQKETSTWSLLALTLVLAVRRPIDAAETSSVILGLREMQTMPLEDSLNELVVDALRVLNPPDKFDGQLPGPQESPLDGLMLYSRSSDNYSQLKVDPFSLIEDACPTISKNDTPIELSLFESYMAPQGR